MSHEIHEPEPPDLVEGQQGQEFHTIIGQDPWLEEFARSPYDPMNSYRATGRLTGLAARHIFRKGWMRVAAFLVGFGMVASSIGWVVLILTSNHVFRAMTLAGLVYTVPFTAIGIKLMVHAVSK